MIEKGVLMLRFNLVVLGDDFTPVNSAVAQDRISYNVSAPMILLWKESHKRLGVREGGDGEKVRGRETEKGKNEPKSEREINCRRSISRIVTSSLCFIRFLFNTNAEIIFWTTFMIMKRCIFYCEKCIPSLFKSKISF